MLWLPNHGAAWCPVYRYVNIHIEDVEDIDTGPDSDNESTSGSDTTIVFGGSEADGHSRKCIPSNQAKLTALMREIHHLNQ